MDKKYLDKVVDQIISETEIDYEKEKVYTSFSPFLFLPPSSFFLSLFTTHCKEVYGLNYEETEYVWNEYKEIIKDKIESNG